MALVEDILDRYKRMKSTRGAWDSWFQALGELFLPNHAEFTTTPARGQRRDKDVYENTHRVAARNFAATIDGMLKPSSPENLLPKAPEYGQDDIFEDAEVAEWVAATRLKMWNAMQRPRANLHTSSLQISTALSVWGHGALFTGENTDRNGLLYKAYPNKDVFFDEGPEGDVDAVAVRLMLTPEQASRRWGEESLGKQTKEALRNKPTGERNKLEFAWLVLPREDRDSRLITNKNMSFASVIVDVASEHVVQESGFMENPFAVPRWDVSPSEVYARSVAAMAFADSKTLQAMAKTLLIGGQRAVDPPTYSFNDQVLSAVRTYPGGHTILEPNAGGGNQPPIGTLDIAGNIPLGFEMQRDMREQVKMAFYRDLFASAAESPTRTATEIIERKEEAIRILGPTFARLENDYTGRAIDRTFAIMERAGAFGERPDAIKGMKIRFENMSAMQQLRRQGEAAGFMRSMEAASPLINADPGLLDNFDGDKIVRDMPELFAYRTDWLRSETDRDAIRQQRQEAQQLAFAAEAAPKAAGAVKDIAGAVATGSGS